MSESCNHNCENCSKAEGCESKIQKSSLVSGASVKHCIGVLSGKGGVGKSFVSSYLAVLLARKGYRVGILDADITGPSIPFSFGIKEKALGTDRYIIPAYSKKYGIQIISSNMLLDNDTDPIIWRGPMIGQMVDQFYSQVFWDDLDFLLIDMPPGTSDVPLTVFQSIKIDGIIIASTPQALVNLIVDKSVNMANMMNVPSLGLVSNMAYVKCPNCSEKIYIYGEDKVAEVSKKYNIQTYASVPFDPVITNHVDQGKIEDLEVDYLDSIVTGIEQFKDSVK